MSTPELAGIPIELHAALDQGWRDLWNGLDALQHSWLETYLQQHPQHRAELVRILAASQFAGLALQRTPELLHELLSSGDLWRSYQAATWPARIQAATRAATDEVALMSVLRRVRRREMVRIVWRDIARAADLMETMQDLSLFAEACVNGVIEHAHAHLVASHGEPIGANSGAAQTLVVLAMGKLGAWELNLSSDIDLIFAYPEHGETNGSRQISNHEFFIRLGQRVIKALDATTADGFVFRVDMRLRPYGDGGALALSFDALEEYYQDQGRDWERYAMIKARVIAGDPVAGAQLMTMLRPFTYRRYVDFSAIDALRDMKSMINREVQRRGKAQDVKLGAGGIREIEFIVQSFQLIRGGREIVLQEPRLLRVLELLVAGGHLPASNAEDLREAYVFLRNTEHAIQGYADTQTQMLPTDQEGRARLAWVMGFADWLHFEIALNAHRDRVIEHFSRIITGSGEQPQFLKGATLQWQAIWNAEMEVSARSALLAAAGFEDPDGTLALLNALRESGKLRTLQQASRERLDRSIPLLLAAATAAAQPSMVIARILPLVESVVRRSAYLVLLEENPKALEQLVRLCAASPWIARELASQPVLLDELLDPRSLYQLPDRAALRDELHQQVLHIPWTDLEAQIEVLRYFKLAHDLRCAASEVSGALPLMKVSDYLTFLAETILQHVLSLAWQHLVTRHGAPQRAPGIPCDPDFIVAGYGKLGGIELGHGSDLDLVFVHDADPALTTDGEKPLDNTDFFTRLGQRIIHILTTYTAMGQLYEVDMRLRPSGTSGLLVSTLAAFHAYQTDDAWTWEHQALVRARPVAGCPALARRFEVLRREILARSRDVEKLRLDVLAMRAKMRKHLLRPETSGRDSPMFNLKQSPGGIVDIEFMVQYSVLVWSREHPALSLYTDNIRILDALGQSGLIPAIEAELLTEAYKFYRSAVHRRVLQQQDDTLPAPEYQVMRGAVLRVWDRLFGEEMEPGGMQPQLRSRT